jgi:hypothetical protein
MARKLPDGILKSFAKFTENTEIPSIFALWVGISTVSAAMGRDCFVDLGHFTVYPNLYIVLVAGSAKCRKSTSINAGRKFMEKIIPAVKMLSQKMTPEALIGALSGMTAEGDSKILNEAEGILVVDELATLIDRNAFKTGMIPILTKLYDCEDFPYETRGRGIEDVRNPCLSMLGGSTSEWIKESIPIAAIGGGFTSRVIFVFKDSYERLVPWPFMSEETRKLGDAIAHDLNKVAEMRGGFSLSDKAKKIYENEYMRFMKESSLFEDSNLAGYSGRRHITLLKVAMVISASMRDDRLIDEIDMKIAISAMTMVEENMPDVLKTIRNEFVGDASEEVLKIIMGSPFVHRSTLVKKMAYKLSAQQLNVILDTLLEYEDKDGKRIIAVEKEGTRTKYVYLRK